MATIRNGYYPRPDEGDQCQGYLLAGLRVVGATRGQSGGSKKCGCCERAQPTLNARGVM